MFRASTCPSSGGQIVLSQYLVSSLSVNGRTVCRMIAESAELALIRHTVQPFTESGDTRCCDNTICPPEDGHVDARNMLRIVVYHAYCYRIKELCIKLVIEISLFPFVFSYVKPSLFKVPAHCLALPNLLCAKVTPVQFNLVPSKRLNLGVCDTNRSNFALLFSSAEHSRYGMLRYKQVNRLVNCAFSLWLSYLLARIRLP